MAPNNEQELWAEIDAKCDAFERDRRRGQEPSISEYLADDWPSDYRRILFSELLSLDFEYSTQAGKTIDAASYTREFPQHADLIQHCLSQHESRAASLTDPDCKPTQGMSHPRGSLESLSGTTLGHYELLEEIGRGGMGVVYRARDQQLQRTVAVKVVLAGEFASHEAMERFQTEARAAAQLDHPNIVSVFDVGNAAGQPYFAMGLVEGHDLAEEVSENVFDPLAAAELTLKLAKTLHYAHQRGIIHRDLNPANILLDKRGEPRVTDFGLAKDLNLTGDSELTRTGQLLGTPSYMAPEQASGRVNESGPLTDVYALGAVLYYVLTGRPPFRAASMVETLKQVVHDEPLSPRFVNTQVDRDLATICLKCLRKDPRQRYESCQQLAEDLQRYLNGESIHARPVSAMSRLARWCKRHPAKAVSVAMVLLLIAATSIAFEYRRVAEIRQQAADTATFFRLMNEAATLRERHDPGWTWKVETLLSRALELPKEVHDKMLLREMIVSCQTSFDLRPSRTLGSQALGSRDEPGSMAFSLDGRYFAFGQSINEVRPMLYVYDTGAWDVPKLTFSFFAGADTLWRKLQGDKKVDDGYRSLAFSPDHRYLAAGTRFGKVLVYDLEDANAEPHVLDVWKDEEVTKVAFSHDGHFLYGLVPNHRLRQWEAFANPIDLDRDDLSDFAVDPTGRRLAISGDGPVELRSTLGDRDVRRLAYVGDDIVFSPDGRLLAIEVDQGVLQVEVTYGPSTHHTLLENTGPKDSRAIQYNGERLFSTSGAEWLRVWDATSGELTYRIPFFRKLLALDPVHRLLAARVGTRLQLFELRRPRLRKTLGGFVASPDCTAFANGKLYGKTRHLDYRHYLAEWDCSTGSLESVKGVLSYHPGWEERNSNDTAADLNRQILNTGSLGLVVWGSRDSHACTHILTPAGGSLRLGIESISAESNQSRVEKVRSDNKPILTVAPRERTVLRVPVSVDKLPTSWRHLAVCAVVEANLNGHEGRHIAPGFIRKPTGEENESPGAGDVHRHTHWNLPEFVPGDLWLVPLHRDTREQFANEVDAALEIEADDSFDRVILHDVLVVPLPVDQEGNPQSFNLDRPAISPSGKNVWAVLDDEWVCSWDLDQPDAMRSEWAVRTPGLMHIYDMEVRDDRIYTCARNGAVQLTLPGTGKFDTRMQISDQAINQLDIAADKSWMVTSGDAGQVDLRSLPDNVLVDRIAQMEVPVTSQALSHDEQLLFTGDAGGNAVLWRRVEGSFEKLLSFDRFNNSVLDARFSDDNRWLSIVVNNHSGIYLYDLKAMKQTCSRYGAGFEDGKSVE